MLFHVFTLLGSVPGSDNTGSIQAGRLPVSICIFHDFDRFLLAQVSVDHEMDKVKYGRKPNCKYNLVGILQDADLDNLHDAPIPEKIESNEQDDETVNKLRNNCRSGCTKP